MFLSLPWASSEAFLGEGSPPSKLRDVSLEEKLFSLQFHQYISLSISIGHCLHAYTIFVKTKIKTSFGYYFQCINKSCK